MLGCDRPAIIWISRLNLASRRSALAASSLMRKSKLATICAPWIGTASILVVWHLASAFELVSPAIFPGPMTVLEAGFVGRQDRDRPEAIQGMHHPNRTGLSGGGQRHFQTGGIGAQADEAHATRAPVGGRGIL